MLETLKKLESYTVFSHFYNINQIPRGSGNEKAISDYLVDFAKKRNLEVIQDFAYNVIIKVKGTPGYENSKPVILQGHMDMVCEKLETSPHDFLKDPIGFIVEGDTLRADNTTLGADNGIALAMAMAVVDSDLPHPPLELLFTVSEETGMDGAIALDPKHINGRHLINIDSEEEGIFLTSCAGGVEVFLTMPLEKSENLQQGLKPYSISVSGLLGGHSGMEIIKERANAIKLLARTLNAIEKPFTLAEISGGSKHNAIPRDAKAIIYCLENDAAEIGESILSSLKTFQNEFLGIDEGIEISFKPELASNLKTTKGFSKELTCDILDLITLIPHGVINMSHSIEGLVETSNNLAIVEQSSNELTLTCAIRSSVRSKKFQVVDALHIIAKRCGAKIHHDGGYPEWQYAPKSHLRDVFIKTYEAVYGEKPQISAIHAGLECGLFSEKFSNEIDQISFGPNIYDVHTPKEHLSISSVERTWKFFCEVLSALK